MRIDQAMIRLLSLLALFDTLHAASLILTLPPHGEECFILHTPPSSAPLVLEASFAQINDDHVNAGPLIILVMDGQQRLVHQVKQHVRGDFHVDLEPKTKYWMCVQNHHRDGADQEDDDYDDDAHDRSDQNGKTRIIGYTYELRASPDLVVEERELGPLQIATEHTETWMGKADSMRQTLKALTSHHGYMRTREESHRQMTESTFTAILTWTMVEATVVILTVSNGLSGRLD